MFYSPIDPTDSHCSCGEGACSRLAGLALQCEAPIKKGLLRSPAGASSLATKALLPRVQRWSFKKAPPPPVHAGPRGHVDGS
jgi:hypothetical protein